MAYRRRRTGRRTSTRRSFRGGSSSRSRRSYRSGGGSRRRFSRSGTRSQTVRIVLENASGAAPLGAGAFAPGVTTAGQVMAAPPLRRARF